MLLQLVTRDVRTQNLVDASDQIYVLELQHVLENVVLDIRHVRTLRRIFLELPYCELKYRAKQHTIWALSHCRPVDGRTREVEAAREKPL